MSSEETVSIDIEEAEVVSKNNMSIDERRVIVEEHESPEDTFRDYIVNRLLGKDSDNHRYVVLFGTEGEKPYGLSVVSMEDNFEEACLIAARKSVIEEVPVEKEVSLV